MEFANKEIPLKGRPSPNTLGRGMTHDSPLCLSPFRAGLCAHLSLPGKDRATQLEEFGS